MKCPKCDAEGTLVYSEYFQYSVDRKVLKDGRLARKSKKSYSSSEEWGSVTCSACGAYFTTETRGDGGVGLDEDGRIYFT